MTCENCKDKWNDHKPFNLIRLSDGVHKLCDNCDEKFRNGNLFFKEDGEPFDKDFHAELVQTQL